MIEFLRSAAGASVAILVIGFLSKSWFVARIGESIRHEYEQKLERIREDARIREKSQLIAELFAEWIRFPEDQTRLNQLTLEAFLWLPDDIAEDLSGLLSHKRPELEIRELVARVRLHLLGSTSITHREIIIFTQESSLRQQDQMRAREAQQCAAAERQTATQLGGD
jgi:hypothetical protein